jgi:hypothetical protein
VVRRTISVDLLLLRDNHSATVGGLSFQLYEDHEIHKTLPNLLQMLRRRVIFDRHCKLQGYCKPQDLM